LVCPVREFCRAYAEGRQMELPVKRKKGEVPVVRGVALVVTRNAKHKTQNTKPHEEVLLMQRPIGGIWEGMWEFPVVESFEFQASSVEKRIREKLRLQVTNAVDCGEVRHQLTHRSMIFQVVRCEVEQTEQNDNPKQNTNRAQHSKLETRNWKPTLPVSATASGERYVDFRWVEWPLSEESGLPLAKVVWKVAEMAEGRNSKDE
jgi:adenine-specific DNA glycosylase